MLNTKKYKVRISLSIGMMISLFCIALSWKHFYDSEMNKIHSSAVDTVNSIDRLLNEARYTTALARPLLKQSCSAENKVKLGRLAISQDHIRVISLFRNKHLFCSSYDGARSEVEDLHANSKVPLTIFKDNHYISPGETIIVLRSDFEEGSVTASITAHWIADSLNLINVKNPFTLRIGNMELTSQNILKKTSPSDSSSIEPSDKYPFSIVYPLKASNSFVNFLREDILAIVMSLLLGGITSLVILKIYFREKSLSEEIELAISKDEIVPWYQPIIDSSSGSIIGIEVLARWVKPDGEVIPPHHFIPEAESANLIIPLTRHLMHKASKELATLHQNTPRALHIGFNITKVHILETGFITECITFLDAFAPGNVKLTIELSEREHFSEATDLNHRLKKLQNYNIAIALDDFGTGYANIGYLGRLHVDIIKIDRCFISKIGFGQEAENLLEKLIEMIKNTDSKIIAEGVENTAQEKWLINHDITWHQGFFYSPPVPFEKLYKLISSLHPKEY